MPQTAYTSLRDLPVQFDTRGPFTVGETVSGTVNYRPLAEYVDSTVHSVVLNFWARSKTKCVRSTGQSTTVYRGRALLFDFTIPLTEILETDPGQSNNAGRSWRFSTVIPTMSLPGATGPDEWDAAAGFLSNMQQGDQQHALPPSFTYHGHSFMSSVKLEAYIEYVFTCRLQFLKPGKSSVKERITTVPVAVRAQGPPGPLVDLQLRSVTSLLLVKTLQLLPEKQDVNLTFREKMRTAFQPSKIPQYGCQVIVEHPTIIQLSNSIFPFRLKHVPQYDEPATNVPPEWYPALKVTAFSLKIEINTRARTQRTFTRPRVEDRSDKETIYSTKSHANGPEEVGMTLPPDPDQTIDLGVHLGLTVHRTRAGRLRVITGPDSEMGLSKANEMTGDTSAHPSIAPPSYATQIAPSAFSGPLYPTFSTYNISQTHSLSWKIKLAVIGTTSEEHTVQGRAGVVVVEEAPTATERGSRAGYGNEKQIQGSIQMPEATQDPVEQYDEQYRNGHGDWKDVNDFKE